MALRSQADAGDSLQTMALHLLAEGKRELGRDVRVPSSKRASEPETDMWTSPVPAIEQFHQKFPAITRALVLAQPETTSDEDTDDGSARVGTIETSEDARRVLKHARYVRPLDLDTAKEDTSEDDAASASGDSTPAASAALLGEAAQAQVRKTLNARLAKDSDCDLPPGYERVNDGGHFFCRLTQEALAEADEWRVQNGGEALSSEKRTLSPAETAGMMSRLTKSQTFLQW